ncbi:DMT family transporter [Limnohabitans sp. Hippo3]|uniref:DMT family transporter n=1 Tax=Limnohabitans sp. Hippo3 TaxID=1597956 RepID=UPI000D36BF94|nr:EamA family transporter [Limnohabitans sp. Hippo3]PUE39552.1 EamA family transporter [Limnohabitans sp. Hippo3]
MHVSPAKGWLADFLILAAIWGSSFLFMRVAALELGALPTAAVRVAIASVFLLPLMLAKGHWADLRQHWKPVLFVGVLNSGIPFALYSFAVMHITTGFSSILNATVPLFGALVAWLWLGDKPTLSRTVGLAVGFGGVVLLAGGQASFKPNASGIAPVWAVAACLVATTCYALAASFTKKHIPSLPPLVTATGSQIGATLALVLPALWFKPDHWPSASAWWALLVVGVLCTGVAYILYFKLIENSGPARALTVTFLVPVFAIAYGVLFLGESVTAWMLLCGAVILLGTALSSGLVKLPGR